MSWLGTLYKDMGEQTKWEFFQKYLLPCLSVVFLWGMVAGIVLTNLHVGSLERYTRKVQYIFTRMEGTKNSMHNLRIKLEYENESFRLPEENKSFFPRLQKAIHEGDTITLYTRGKWLSILTWGRQEDIFQVDKNGKVLASLSDLTAKKSTHAMLFGIAAFICATWYLLYRQQYLS